jgi:hypothetical protein
MNGTIRAATIGNKIIVVSQGKLAFTIGVFKED